MSAHCETAKDCTDLLTIVYLYLIRIYLRCMYYHSSASTQRQKYNHDKSLLLHECINPAEQKVFREKPSL